MYACSKKLIFCVGLSALELVTPGNVHAQLFGRRVAPAPAAPAPAPQTAPAPQPVPAPQPAADGASSVPTYGPASPATVGQGTADARIIHGRNLIGMRIWGPNQQVLGSIQDFVVDSQGDCPTLYFAVSPQMAGWSGQYVIVPFNAFQFGYDARQRTDVFTLNISAEALQRAPRLAADKWSVNQDRQFFTNARQFYQRTERTAARPETGGNPHLEQSPSTQAPRPGDPQRHEDLQRNQPAPNNPREPQAPRTDKSQAQPETPARPSTAPSGAERQPEAGRQPPPAPDNRNDRPDRNTGK